MHITLELDKHLKERKISLYEFCKVTDISYQQAFDISKKKTKGISFQVLEKICLALNCQINDLLVFEPDAKGYLRHILRDFPDTDNVKRLPQTRQSDSAKPFLQWVGGKREMLKQYAALLPRSYNTYWEPLLGGGALYFHLKPRQATINDSNPELIATYEAIRDEPEAVIELLQLMRRRHSKDLYMAIRSIDRKFNILEEFNKYEIAARMIYLNQTCFNGIYRVNKQGQFNVPIGSSLNRVICDPEAIRKASSLLRKAALHCTDFENLLNNARKGDFVYLDPPYDPISEYSDFTRYTKEKFYKHDQERLADLFGRLDAKGCKIMLSNSKSEFILKLYDHFNIHTVYSGRNLNSRSERRGKVPEVVVTNY